MHRMGLITSKMLKSPKFCNLKVLILSILTLATFLFFVVHVSYFSSVFDDRSFISFKLRRSVPTRSRQELTSRIDWLKNEIQLDTEKLAAAQGGKAPTAKSTSISGNRSLNFDGHKILSLDEKQHQNTPLDELMSWYGEADGGGTCKEDFGNSLIKKWRGTGEPYCSAKESKISSIDCSLIHQTRHYGDGDNLCIMKNVAVNFGLFGDDTKTRPVIEKYVETRHNVQPYIKFPLGFVKADCDVNPALWVPASMPGWNADWTTGALMTVPSIDIGVNRSDGHSKEGRGGPGDLEGRDGSREEDKDGVQGVTCDEWVDHPVLIVQRDTFANFFHDSEDFLNVFIAMAVLQWKKENTQIYLTDLYPKGPFWDVWSEAFSPKGPGGEGMKALDAWDLRNSFGQKKSKFNKNEEYHVCYNELAIGIYGPAAPITVASWDTPCSRTALVRAYSDHVIRGLNMQGETHYAAATPSRTIVITFMARRPSAEWPERKYCSDTESFFLCKLWEGFGSRKLGRMVSNEAEVVAALRSLEGQTFPNGAAVRFQDVDYNVLSFKEQIKIDLDTDIMIGPHGAGLMHNIFMRDRATLIELFIDGSGMNRHFHNLARWYGRTYEGLGITNPIDVSQLMQEVKAAVGKIDLNSY